jgi:hypothetical protein
LIEENRELTKTRGVSTSKSITLLRTTSVRREGQMMQGETALFVVSVSVADFIFIVAYNTQNPKVLGGVGAVCQGGSFNPPKHIP